MSNAVQLPAAATASACARLSRGRAAPRAPAARRAAGRRPAFGRLACRATAVPPPPLPPRASTPAPVAQLSVAAPPPPAASAPPAVPLPVVAGAVSVALLGLLLWRPWIKRGSVGKLASRGVGLAVERDVDDERFFKGMMDGVRTTATPELTPEAIEAARQRRRANTRLDRSVGEELNTTAVPTNHPWATTKGRLTPEEEEAKRAEVMRRNATPRRSMGGDGSAPPE